MTTTQNERPATQDRRPSLQRKHNRTTEAKANAALDTGVSIALDGVEYVVRAGDLNAMDSRELRRQVGMTFFEILDALGKSADLDLIAALIWLARRVKGEPLLTFEEVALGLTYNDLDRLQMGEAQAEEIDASNPEA